MHDWVLSTNSTVRGKQHQKEHVQLHYTTETELYRKPFRKVCLKRRLGFSPSSSGDRILLGHSRLRFPSGGPTRWHRPRHW